ncbi:glutamyl-tRNA synthetase [Malaciobacter marinus]|uniref:Glutamate--tRNA ligase n=1 Tax=Malaciobacter marinus TaxID=505249 RepID=A0A347TKI3_9BACT|nr:glutamate--tRNA ligase family protein [Malaciobacter marinus]AXX87111.1 glutamyl-tRNA synthetase [Malaciobacter marinus]PHO16321.1 glutamate--tRNA ligase [Malaciobacter marinus]
MLRIALSPTKDIDLEDLRIALLNYIISKKTDEELVIRIDDANKDKNIEGKDKEILELLNLFSIEHSRVIYQSENIKYHQKLAMQLMTQKKAFSCFCSDTKLNELKESAKKEGKNYNYDDFCANLSDEIILEVNAAFTVRIKRPIDNIKLIDSFNGEFDYTPNDIDSFIILNHDKTPTTEYACAVDDMIYDITMVINKKEHILSASRQIHIRNSLGYKKDINYIHLPSILNEKENSNSIKWLIEEGFLPVAIANYLVFLGNETPKEIFTLEEAIQWFDIKNISNKKVIFDFEKLKTINKKHLELIDDLRLSKLLGFADTDIGKLGKLFLSETSTLNGIKEKLNLIFSKKNLCKDFEDESKQIIKCLKEAPHIDDFNNFKNYITQNTGLKDDSLLMPLRYLLTKEENGVNLSDIYPYIKNYLGEIIK